MPGIGLGNTCTVSVVELWVPSSGMPTQGASNWSVDSHLREPQLEFYGWPIFDSRFMKFVFRISGGMKFWDLSWGLRHWLPEFDCRSERMLIYDFHSDMWTLFEKRWGEAESIIKWGGWGGSNLHGKNEEKLMTHLKFYH